MSGASTDPQRALLTARTALILTLGLIAAFLAGGLTFLQSKSFPSALLAAGGAGLAVILAGAQLIGD